VSRRPHLLDLAGELLGARGVAAQGLPHRGGEAERASQPQVHAPRGERLEQQELLGDHERAVVGEHDAAGAQADPRGALADRGEQHRRGGARDARDGMVLGDPEAVVTERLRSDGPLDAVPGRRLLGQAGARAGAIEEGQFHGIRNAATPASLPVPGPPGG